MVNRQLSALQDSKTTRIILPYKRQYVIFAVYEVLDKNGSEYEKNRRIHHFSRDVGIR